MKDKGRARDGFQEHVQQRMREGKSVLLIAPTGLGKTRAVCGDLQDAFQKTVYAVPLRALGAGIKRELSSSSYARNGRNLCPVIHHGDTQESRLFSEEIVITTYDQVVCGLPGLPLSLPLKSGHAVAGALLMSRLVLDEAHLAWGISPNALPILLGIIDFRLRLNLQTVVLTATLPEAVADQLRERLGGLEVVVVGKGDLTNDRRLQLREENRRVSISIVSLKNTKTSTGDDRKDIDWAPLDIALAKGTGKRIYFANTVERLQQTYDRLIENGLSSDRITVLHNRMPRRWREKAEALVLSERFGKGCPDGDWVLLTNRVAEAGLDISAPLVISDPAPVDTLVQRAGRCARWFDKGRVEGTFCIISLPKAQMPELVAPYRSDFVEAALKNPPTQLNWQSELDWINESWGKDPKKAREAVDEALNQTAFALNLFDRASQSRNPGTIADAFREILTVEIAIDPICSQQVLEERVTSNERPQTSSVSLGRARLLARDAGQQVKAIRYDDGDLKVVEADYVELGDIVIVPPTIAYLHTAKGLCFGDGTRASSTAVVIESEWETDQSQSATLPREGGQRQTLIKHLRGVMRRVQERLTTEGAYRTALTKIIRALEPEPEKNPAVLVDAVAQIATLGAGFHDFGKADVTWQGRARALDPDAGPELIGRTGNQRARMNHPHTPPAFHATVKASEMLLGGLNSATHLVRAIALAAARHHSSFLNPAFVRGYRFQSHRAAEALVRDILLEAHAPPSVIERATEIVSAAEAAPDNSEIPLALPNDDLFPIYALVGRAILMADREDASGMLLEDWKE